MVLRCVVGWIGSCVRAVQRFSFRVLGWGGQLVGGRGGSVVFTATPQEI